MMIVYYHSLSQLFMTFEVFHKDVAALLNKIGTKEYVRKKHYELLVKMPSLGCLFFAFFICI
jgi:hypothetical protein